jgi:hypothetical protein
MTTTSRKRAIRELLTEVVLSILPMLVVLLVMVYMDKPGKLFMKPEWAFAASIFFGQSLVRLVSAMTGKHPRMEAGSVALFAALVLVLGLVPSLLVLVFVIHSAELTNTVSTFFQAAQCVQFFGGAFTYVVVGAVCHEVSPR